MKLLTFLGVGKYEDTTYVWGDLEHTCRFAPLASCYFLRPESLIVFLTDEAGIKVFPDLHQELPPGLPVQQISVPLGQNNLELWKIFEQVSGAVLPGEEVAFDITHGLRSFPLVGLLAAAFLRSGLNVLLQAVLYGAYDVRDKTTTPTRTPMFDLSPMLALLEWATAADRFIRSGDARQLASLVNAQRKQLALAGQGDHDLLEQAGRLGNLAGALTGISQSLRLIRPHQVMQQAAGLAERVQAAQPGLDRAAPARPFNLLLENIVQAYTPLAQASPLEKTHLHHTLVVERRLVHWYAEREQWVQAVSLAREWLVTWVMVRLNVTQIISRDQRQRIENVISAEASEYMASKKKGVPFSSLFLASLPQLESVLALWLSLTDVRNDIDHAGMREEPGDPQNLIQQIQACLETIDGLPI